jgi:hypothetical protein
MGEVVMHGMSRLSEGDLRAAAAYLTHPDPKHAGGGPPMPSRRRTFPSWRPIDRSRNRVHPGSAMQGLLPILVRFGSVVLLVLAGLAATQAAAQAMGHGAHCAERVAIAGPSIDAGHADAHVGEHGSDAGASHDGTHGPCTAHQCAGPLLVNAEIGGSYRLTRVLAGRACDTIPAIFRPEAIQRLPKV